MRQAGLKMGLSGRHGVHSPKVGALLQGRKCVLWKGGIRVMVMVMVRVTCCRLRNQEHAPRVRVMVRVMVRVRVRPLFECRSGDRTRFEGFCNFEKVPPDQLCPSAERD